jgi:glycosyltransferase involved in cell wall biosynthesis
MSGAVVDGSPAASGRPRVLVVTTVHVADDARIMTRQVRSLIDAGMVVAVAAPWTATGARVPAGVTPIDLPRSRGRRRVRSLLAARRVLVDASSMADLVIVHDPELLPLVRAVGVDRLPPVVWDVHEDVAASLVDRAWVPRPLRRAAGALVRRWERWAERSLHLVLAEEGYRSRFASPHPVVRNLPWTPSAPSPAVPSGGDVGPRRVVHVGRLSRGRGADELVAVGDRLASHGIAVDLVGVPDAEVRPMLEEAVRRGSVRLHGHVPNERLDETLRGAVAGLCLLHDLPNYRVSLPTKVVEYLVHGLPVVATRLPEVAALATRIGGIALVDVGDVDATVEAVLAIAAGGGVPGEDRPFDAVVTHARRELVWEPEGDRFVELVRGWASSASAVPTRQDPRPEVDG